MTERCDVAIVGAGPSGLALAILLAERGHRVDVVERWLAPYPLPRAVHFDHETARILQALGVAGELEGFTESAPIYEWRNARGEILLRFGREKESGLGGWPESNMFHQPRFEAALERRARTFPNLRLVRGAEVHLLHDAGDAVHLAARTEQGEAFELSARYVIGCDGANSFVRQAIGATWHDTGFAYDWLVVDLVPHETRVWSPLNGQLCDPARPTTMVSGGPGRRRFEFMRLPGETNEDLADLDHVWQLLAPFDLRPDNATLERRAVYTFRACWSESWRRGRVLLAGDAAHLTPPFAGQGMCAGLRDAANLAWKLDLVLRRQTQDALLDSYASERVPHVRTLIDFAVELGRVICVLDPEEAAQRDARLVPAARASGLVTPAPGPKLGSGCWVDASRAGGEFCVQGRVARGAEVGRFDDLFGARFALISIAGDPAAFLSEDQRAYLASLGGIAVQVTPNAVPQAAANSALEPVFDAAGQAARQADHEAAPEAGQPAPPHVVADVDGAYARFFAAHGIAVLLQRPDFAVFAAAETLAESGSLLDALRARLSAAA